MGAAILDSMNKLRHKIVKNRRIVTPSTIPMEDPLEIIHAEYEKNPSTNEREGQGEQFETADSHTALYGGSGSPRKKNRRLIYMAVGVGVVVALVLIITLSVTLTDSSSDSSQPKVTGCPSFPSQSRSHARDTRSARPRSRSKRWLHEAECPVLGEPSCPAGFSEPPLILVSMDGFRADYLKRGLTPHLQKLSDCGVHAPYMRASFPTKTFPNHYTLITGLFTEAHGIIDNTMYDMERHEQFLRGDTALDGTWWGGEPMWLTSKRQGKKSATMFWPGSDSDIQGEYPDYCYMYDESVGFGERIDTVLDWLDLPEDERPSFITLYLEEPDSTGHSSGPFFDEMDVMLERMDALIGDLLDGLQERELSQCVNLVLLADHGMGELFCDDKTVYLDKYLDTSQYYLYTGVTGRISSQYVERNDQIEEVEDPESPEDTLAKLECRHYNDSKDYYARFYHKRELPVRFHYAASHRIDPVVIEVEDKWKVYETEVEWCEYGSHGYDSTYKSMHAMFMAYGPHFQQRLEVEPFDNIEVYNLLADVLGVDPAPNNGTRGRLNMMLSNPAHVAATQAEGSYVQCEFPDDEEAERRRNASDCQCADLEDLTDQTLEELDERLNLTEAEAAAALAAHLPYGVPELGSADTEACVLSQRDYVSGYSHTHRMPLWSAFTVNRVEGASVLDGDTRTDKYFPDCVRVDVRLQNATQCLHYVDQASNIHPAFLFPPGLGNTTEDELDGHISSNIVPMYETFRTGIWQDLLFVVEEYAEKYGSIQVLTGPVFDYNADGHADELTDIEMFMGDGPVPLPTHYFLSVSRCDDVTDACANSTEVMSVVLYHREALSNCWDLRPFVYMQENVARLADIEALTALQLLPSITDTQQRLLLSTHLAVGLWPRPSWMDLTDDQALMDAADCPAGYNEEHPPVILISLDGFRPDYMQRNLTPVLERIQRLGVSPEYLRPIYPTMTFPNHYTISTGLYPESNGIVDNSMYDQELQQDFYLGSESAYNSSWWLGEPIWNTVELQNKTAMTYFWPGSDVDIGGIRPTQYRVYDGDHPYHMRVDTALHWLNGSAGVTPDFISLYFSNTDSAGHEGGPDSLLVDEALEYVDGYIKRLMDGLYRMRLHKCINLVIVSDHGMSDISCERVVVADDYLAPGTLEDVYMYYGTSSRIANQYNSDFNHVPEAERVPYSELAANLTCVSEHLHVFEKRMLPRRHHYMRHARIDDLVFVLNETWQADRYGPWCGILGQHGWDPNFSNLRAFFTAFGPAFEQQKSVEAFGNIEIYNLLARLSNVTAAPNNGTEGSLYELLKSPPAVPESLATQDYGDCSYPSDDAVYEQRANETDCPCEITDIRSADERLDFTDAEKAALVSTHVPHGMPGLLDTSACVLHHAHFLAAYSSDIVMPLWSAFTLSADQLETGVEVPGCLRPDVRVETSLLPNCSDYYDDTIDIEPAYLFPPEWSSSENNVTDALLTSNIVPMLTQFKTGLWQEMLGLVEDWTHAHGTLHGVMGPLFDYEADGLRDTRLNITVGDSRIPIPSHFYVILLRCESTDCDDTMEYDTQAFVLPHQRNITNCMTPLAFAQDNIARIRDVELLAGLEFLTAAENEAARRTAVRTRTRTSDTWW